MEIENGRRKMQKANGIKNHTQFSIDISQLAAFYQNTTNQPPKQVIKMFKIIALVACLAFVAAMPYEDYHSHPSYKYEYGVKDSHTHDHKSQWEHREGDHVTGQYTLDEADGTHRVVDYSSDHKTGFQPHVQRIGHAHHPHHGESYANIKQHY